MQSTIRIGTADDVPAVQQLLDETSKGASVQVLATEPGTRYLLVLADPDGGVAGAAQLTFDGGHGHLALLAIAARFHGEGIEHRLIGVAEALCDAFGCDTFDVRASQRAA